jgi:tetratricopeptide (TPR) repeat protein
MAVNQQLVSGAPPAEALRALQTFPPARQSAILTEKLADLYWARGSMTDAIDTYEVALKRGPSRAQRRRLLLGVAERRVASGPDEDALAHFRTFLKENPDDPESLRVYQAMLPLAKRRGLTNEVDKIESEIKRLIRP